MPAKVCDISLRSGKGRADNTSMPQTNPPADGDASMANVAEVLKEIKLLRADFGSKLDNIESRLTTMAS